MFNLLPPDIEHQQFRHLLQVFQNNIQALFNYKSKNPVNRIILFRASSSVFHDNPTLGWENFSIEPVQIINILGDHYTMLAKPYISYLQPAMNEYLEQVD
ncbi:MAG: hypothetical protein C4323_24810 [Mastigocladus sp. ERB_26_2]